MTEPDPTPAPETLADYVRHGMAQRGLDSLRGLHREAGISLQTVSRLLDGVGVPTEETLQRVADALGLSIQRMRELAHRPRGEPEPFVLPERANQLSKRQREAIVELIDSILEERPSPGTAGGNGQTPPQDG